MSSSPSGAGVEPHFETPPRAFQADRKLDSFADFLSRYRYGFLGLATVAYLAITGYQAHRRLFWFDEIFTFYVSQLPDVRAIWAACTHGVDFNPPLLYLLTRWSQDLLGANELGTRLPQILGFWTFCLCLYRFVSVRFGAIAGFTAMLIPLTASGYWYAYDARSHGLVLGFFGLALISWQAAASRMWPRWVAYVLLAASLTCATLCHCYAFLLFIPLGVGELARTLSRRRFDAALWCALTLPIIGSVVTIPPMLHGVKASLSPAQFALPISKMWSGWELAFTSSSAVTFLLAFLLLAATPGWWRPDEPRGARRSFTSFEAAAVGAILATPVFAFLSARLAHAPMYGRYSLVVLAGVGCLFALACARNRTAGLLLLSVTVLLVGRDFVGFHQGSYVNEPATRLPIGTFPAVWAFGFDSLETSAPGSDPIVLQDDLEFAPMFYYAPASLRSRLVYLIPENNGEGYSRLEQCCGAPGRVIDRQEFLAAHRTFYLYGRDVGVPFGNEIFARRDGRIAVQGCFAEHCLFHVDFPPQELERGR